MAAAIGLIGGTLVTLVWTLAWLEQGAESAGLRSWWWALYLLIAVGTAAGYGIWGWRSWRARRARR